MRQSWLAPAIFLALAVAIRAAEPVLPVFTDVTVPAKIQFKHSFGDLEMDNIVEASGGGAVVFDYDNDGWLDVYLVNGRWQQDVSSNRGRNLRGKLRNALYHNNHDGTFTDVTEKAGVAGKHYGCGATAADFDGDGNCDLFVCNFGADELYRNNGDGTFTDVTKEAGLVDTYWSLQAVWFDYDGDGDLDLYVVNYLDYLSGKDIPFYKPVGFPGPLSYHGQPDILYRNNGNGTFTDVTKEAGLWNPEGRGMGVTVADLDNDGKLDIYVTNDAMANDYFHNLGGGKFAEEALLRGMAFGEGGQGVSSMGPDVGDVDHDGWLDLYIPDMDYGCLLLNRKQFFEDRTTPVGLAQICGQYTGWGGLLFDYDNDGWLDIYVANGDPHHEYAEEDVLARNDGNWPAGKFVDVAKQSGSYFREKYVGRGATYFDYDNDGDLDVLLNNLNAPAKLLRNDGGNRNHWLTLNVKLRNGKSDAIGARIRVTTGSLTQFQDLIPVRGYLSQADPRPHFGLGKAAKADRVEIHWPDGRKTELQNVAADQILAVVEPAP